MSKLTTAARLFLGLVFTVFGLNFFLQFLPQPPMTGAPAAFAGALFATGYMFPLIKSLEIAAGIALLTNRYVTLALAVLAPIVVNIALFHGVLEGAGAGIVLPLLLVALELFLAYSYRAAYAPMLAAKVAPTTSESAPAPALAPAE